MHQNLEDTGIINYIGWQWCMHVYMHTLYVYSYNSFNCVNTCRLQLAALHFNENTNRKQALTKQGTRRYDLVFPKYKKGGYVVKKVLINATYGMDVRHIAVAT